jgi:nicotinamide mononucleotide transporter
VTTMCAWLLAHGMSCLELVAVAFGIWGVYLSIRESIWNWPIGMINVALYSVLFLRQKLLANAALQLVYFALSAYGWWEWLYGGAARTPLAVTRGSTRLRTGAAAAGVAIWAILLVATRSTGGAMPVFDAGTTAASLVAEWMLARKLIDNWAVWIVVDGIYVGMLIADHLYLTAFNYAIYFLLAIMGYAAWRRAPAVTSA